MERHLAAAIAAHRHQQQPLRGRRIGERVEPRGDEIMGEAEDLIGQEGISGWPPRCRHRASPRAAARSRRGRAASACLRIAARLPAVRAVEPVGDRAAVDDLALAGDREERGAHPPLLGLRAASAGRSAPAPRAGRGCRARSRPARRGADRAPPPPAPPRRTAADRRGRRRCRRSRRGPPPAWRAPIWRGPAPAAAGRPAWRRRCRSCGRRGRSATSCRRTRSPFHSRARTWWSESASSRSASRVSS